MFSASAGANLLRRLVVVVAEDRVAAARHAPERLEGGSERPGCRVALHREEVAGEEYEVGIVVDEVVDELVEAMDGLPRTEVRIRDLYDAERPLGRRGRPPAVALDGHAAELLGAVRLEPHPDDLEERPARREGRDRPDRVGDEVEGREHPQRLLPAEGPHRDPEDGEEEQPHRRERARRNERLAGRRHAPAEEPAPHPRSGQVDVVRRSGGHPVREGHLDDLQVGRPEPAGEPGVGDERPGQRDRHDDAAEDRERATPPDPRVGGHGDAGRHGERRKHEREPVVHSARRLPHAPRPGRPPGAGPQSRPATRRVRVPGAGAEITDTGFSPQPEP